MVFQITRCLSDVFYPPFWDGVAPINNLQLDHTSLKCFKTISLCEKVLLGEFNEDEKFMSFQEEKIQCVLCQKNWFHKLKKKF